MPEVLHPILDDWWSLVIETDEDDVSLPVGLWLTGPRGIGSSFIAKRALRRCYTFYALPPMATNVDDITTAHQLVAKIKEQWFLESGVRSHQNDDALFNEAAQVGLQVDWWLNTGPCVLLDDLHQASYDGAFFNRHIWPSLESRIKNGQVLIVSSDMSPGDVLGDYWPSLFTAVDLGALEIDLRA